MQKYAEDMECIYIKKKKLEIPKKSCHGNCRNLGSAAQNGLNNVPVWLVFSLNGLEFMY